MNDKQKKCYKCKETKSIIFFTKASNRKDGLQGMCKSCRSEYSKNYQKNNSEVYQKAYKKYSRTEKAKEKSKRNHINNKENELEYGRKYYSLNKEKRKNYHKEWIENNREHINKYQRNRLQNPYHNFCNKIRGALRRSFKICGTNKKSRTFDFLKYSPEDLYKHLSENLNKPCEMCKSEIVTVLNNHIDHIIPLSSGKDEKDIFKLNQLKNLRLICPSCNIIKGNKL